MLKTKNFFPFVRFLRKLNIRQEILAMFQKAAEIEKEIAACAAGKQSEGAVGVDEHGEEIADKNRKRLNEEQERLGIDMALTIIEHSGDAEKEFYAFMESYTGKSRAEIEDMAFGELKEVITGIIQDGSFLGFFSQAVKQTT